MAQLVLGPLLRYVGEQEATVWVETDAPCEVEVLGCAAHTVHVEGHHYALVCVTGLAPESTHRYAVRLDGRRAWPPEDRSWPPSVIRTRGRAEDGTHHFRLAFGSCRVAAPHQPPWTLPRWRHPSGRGVDALRGYAQRMRDQPHHSWPDALLLLGDQVYADDASPRTRAFIRQRRDVSQPPGEEVADFEEYTRLYREAWEEPTIRWLMSTVPTAMIFDDHDITDDWNISASWVEDMRSKSWWRSRIVGGIMAYWLYQHLGNLSPARLAEEGLFRQVGEADDAGPILRAFAEAADRDSSTAQWSFHRDYGPARLVVIDSRAGRTLADGRRDMLDEAEWAWVGEKLLDHQAGHLLVASSLPFLLTPGIHGLEAWNEAICDGAWGRGAAWIGERIRRAFDLEHWAAFRRSFERLCELLHAAGSRPEAPATIVLLSGDVHHTYLMEVAFPSAPPVASRIFQAVASPIRNTEGRLIRVAYRIALSRFGEATGRGLARAAGVAEPPLRWRMTSGPRFDNQVSVLEFHGGAARLRVEAVTGGSASSPQLRTVIDRQLTHER